MEGISMPGLKMKNPVEVFIPVLLTALVFFTPISTSLRSLLIPLTGICILLVPGFRKRLWPVLKSPLFLSIFFFLLWIVLALSWSDASWKEGKLIIEKYGKLLFIPLLAIGFQHGRTRQFALNAFLAAIALTLVVSILIPNPQSSVFFNHIVTGALMAFGAWFAFFMASRHQQGKRRFFLILGFLCSYQVLFVNTGRTGYVLFGILMLTLFIQVFSYRWMMVASAIFIPLLGLCFYLSPVMYKGLGEVVSNVQNYQEDKDTSIGYRLQFHSYAKSLFEKHPLVGNGTGAFAENYNRDNPLPSFASKYFEPHGQYWLIAVEQGMVGLLFLALFMLSLLHLSQKTKEAGPVLFAWLILFNLVCFSDSVLLISPLGWLLVIFSAICLGENMDRTRRIFR